MGYIRVPIETNPETLSQEIFDYIITQEPNWTPADGNLDTWIIRATAAKAAETRDLASDVPDSIFASFGSSLMAIPPIDAVAASGNTTWTLANTSGHTIPAGTFLGLRNSNGDLVTFLTLSDVIVAPGDSVTAAGEVQILAIDAGTDANGLSSIPELITVLDWVTSIAIVGTTGGGVDAETNDDYLNRLVRKLQGLSTVPILPIDFANAAKDADPGVFRSVAIDLYNPFHNFLTANEADAETDASGWANLANSAVATDSTQHLSGAKDIKLTSVASGDMNAILVTGKPVTVGQAYTAKCSARSAVSARSVKIGIRWIDGSSTTISTVYGTPANDSTSAWTNYFVTAIAPPTAVTCKIILFVTATGGASEVHFFDEMSLRHGSTTDWVAGGTAETGNIKTITEAAVDSLGAAVSGTIKTNINNYIQARRETNWINHVMDPNYTNIDVATTVVVLPNNDPAAVHDAVVAAITAYLDPSAWGQDPNLTGSDAATSWVDTTTLYYNELITLVSNVPGVNRVTALTCNVHGNTPGIIDVPLQQPAALTTVGTITCTIT